MPNQVAFIPNRGKEKYHFSSTLKLRPEEIRRKAVHESIQSFCRNFDSGLYGNRSKPQRSLISWQNNSSTFAAVSTGRVVYIFDASKNEFLEPPIRHPSMAGGIFALQWCNNQKCAFFFGTENGLGYCKLDPERSSFLDSENIFFNFWSHPSKLPVDQIEVSPRGRTVAVLSSGEEKFVHIVDYVLNTSFPLYFAKLLSPLNLIRWSPCGSIICAADRNGAAAICETYSWEAELIWKPSPGISCLSWMPQGYFLINPTESTLLIIGHLHPQRTAAHTRQGAVKARLGSTNGSSIQESINAIPELPCTHIDRAPFEINTSQLPLHINPKWAVDDVVCSSSSDFWDNSGTVNKNGESLCYVAISFRRKKEIPLKTWTSKVINIYRLLCDMLVFLTSWVLVLQKLGNHSEKGSESDTRSNPTSDGLLSKGSVADEDEHGSFVAVYSCIMKPVLSMKLVSVVTPTHCDHVSAPKMRNSLSKSSLRILPSALSSPSIPSSGSATDNQDTSLSPHNVSTSHIGDNRRVDDLISSAAECVSLPHPVSFTFGYKKKSTTALTLKEMEISPVGNNVNIMTRSSGASLLPISAPAWRSSSHASADCSVICIVWSDGAVSTQEIRN